MGCRAAQIPDEHDHFSQRAPWLRAGVLGANDGLVSVASLMLGVGGGSDSLHIVVLAGVAGLIGGALSMAVGEYISVSSQRYVPRWWILADVDSNVLRENDIAVTCAADQYIEAYATLVYHHAFRQLGP